MAARKAKVSPEENALAENGVLPGAEAGANRDRGGVPKSMPLTHAQIVPDPLNARKSFDPEALAELAETMFTHGLLQPLVVGIETEATAAADAADPEHVHFQLVAGERRWRAWGLLIADGRWSPDHTEDCRIETADERNRMEAALIENLQRVDLNHMEAGEAFEVLGAKFHLSNKEIAAKIGRTPEYVQQHRRLTKLAEDEREAVRSGELSLDQARNILARPRESDLTPAQKVLLAEIMHRMGAAPAKQSYYGHYTECGWEAADDKSGDWDQLQKRGIVRFEARDWQTKRAYLSLGHGAYSFQSHPEFAPLLTSGPDADALLAAHQGHGLVGDDIYSTPWLNGPFALHPDALAEVERDKEIRRAEKDRQRQVREAKKARMAGIEALEARLRAGDQAFLEEEIAVELKALKVTGEITVTPGGIVQIGKKEIFKPHWHFGDDAEAVARLLTMALNMVLASAMAAVGDATPIAEDDDADEIGPVGDELDIEAENELEDAA